MRRFTPLFAFASVVFVAAACGSGDDAPTPSTSTQGGAGGDASGGSAGAPLPVVMTTERALLIAHAVANPPDAEHNPANPKYVQRYLDQGFGDVTVSAGEPYVTRTFDGSTPPAPGPNAKRWLHFAHLADLQIADDESPTRFGDTDAIGPTSSALRPQDADLCAMTNAAVRAIDALHAKDPYAFTLLGGDNADSAQTNEIDWVLGMFTGGAPVECDSGADDDIIPGPGNDGKDPFDPPGLSMPWKWVTGNHDVLVQGNFPVEQYAAQALGNTCASGTRNYKDGGADEDGSGEDTDDFIVPDQRRALLTRSDLMAKIRTHGDGHGLSDANVASGRAFYTFDVDGTPLRFVILDTGAEQGGAEGIIHQADIDAVVEPALADADANGKYVVLASHHSATNLSLDGGTFGTKQADALSSDQWQAYLGGHKSVMLSMVGHSHELRVATPGTPRPYWEVMTSAIADHPHEFRDVEIWDQDDGYIMIRATAVDIDLSDPIAAQGRTLGVVDVTSGWNPAGDGRGQPSDRNVELWFKKN